jgi:hypothetical protein
MMHIMPEGQASAHIVGNRAYILLSIPSKALAAFDDDHDGLISRAELGRHGTQIDSALRQRVHFFGDRVPGRIAWQTLSIEHSDTPDAPMAALTLVRVDEWDRPPATLRVVTDLAPAAPSGRIEFRAILGEKNDRTEIDTLTAERNDLTFFQPKPAPTLGRIDAGLLILLLIVLGGVMLSRRWRWSGWRNRSAPQPSPR